MLAKFFPPYRLSLFVKPLLNLPLTAANYAIQQGPIAGWALGNVSESYFGYSWRPHQMLLSSPLVNAKTPWDTL